MTIHDLTNPDVVFESMYYGMTYEVMVWDVPEGIGIVLKDYGTFDRMVLAITPDLTNIQAQIIVRAEYGKCLLEAARRLQKVSWPEEGESNI